MEMLETGYGRTQRPERRMGSGRISQPRARREEMWPQGRGANGQGERLAGILGWFSIGLGLAEVLEPRRVARMIGVDGDGDARDVLLAMGLREIANGIGILAQPHSAGWLWARVGGDVMDLALLSSALHSRRNDQGKIAGAIAIAAGAAALDVYCGRQLSRSRYVPRQRRYTPGRTRERMPAQRGVHVRKTVTVNRPVEEVYRFWHDFENLPRFMSHLESVQVTGERRSHWKAKAPAGMSVEWDAEVTDDRPNELIAWRSMEGADVDNAGSIRFKPAPGNRGTEIDVELRYDPPGGRIGAMVAKLFGEEPEEQVKSDLRRFKQVMEIGEVVHSDASIHRGMHPARPAAENERVRLVGNR